MVLLYWWVEVMARTTQGLTSSDYILLGEMATKANDIQLQVVIDYFTHHLKKRKEDKD